MEGRAGPEVMARQEPSQGDSLPKPILREAVMTCLVRKLSELRSF